MNNALNIAQNLMLHPAGLVENDISKGLDYLLGHKIDAGDIYFQYSQTETWLLEEGIIKDGGFHIEQGVGVRAISGEKTGFAYSDNLELPALLKSAGTAREIARSGQDLQQKISSIAPSVSSAKQLYQPIDPSLAISNEEKIQLLQHIDAYTRALDTRVDQVIVSMVSVYDVIMVAAVDGTMAADVRPLVRLNVTVMVEENGKREQGSAGAGGRQGLDMFIAIHEGKSKAEAMAKDAVRQALVNLESVAAPAGPMTVVLGPGWPGVLLHEAVGHGLEGDFNRKGTSAFSGRIGEKVASELCTVVDDGTMMNRRGSLSIDDEGVESQNTVLIENGILKAYMQDKMNASLMNQVSTGNGRRESYAHLPMPRMTNTYMLSGNHSHDEILASVKHGIYAVNFGGGQVDITSGKFVFSVSEGYLIENGKITTPVKGATLIGSGPDVMQKISMVGDNLGLDDGVGTCGKEGQSVPVGVGQPTLKIDEITVGGTQTG